MLQYRIAAEGGVRDVDESKREVLVSFPWEVIDTYNTDFSRDAFDEHLRQSLPVMCWQHQRTEPIGRAKHWEKTAAANELIAGFSDFDAVPRARQAFAQIRDKELTDFSYGFDKGKTTPHPEVRGAVRFTSARMAEISPVSVGSIPGAIAVSIRAEAEIANVRGLVDAGAISEDDADRMLREAGITTPRESITLVQALATALDGKRGVTVTIDDDGKVEVSERAAEPAETVVDGTAPDAEVQTADSELPALLRAVDATLDQGQALLDGVDTETLPTEVRQALDLFAAAGVAIDEALDVAGIPDDDVDDTERAAATSSEGAVVVAEVSAELAELAEELREVDSGDEAAQLDAEAAAALATLNKIR